MKLQLQLDTLNLSANQKSLFNEADKEIQNLVGRRTYISESSFGENVVGVGRPYHDGDIQLFAVVLPGFWYNGVPEAWKQAVWSRLDELVDSMEWVKLFGKEIVI